jgi:hypothetical protein
VTAPAGQRCAWPGCQVTAKHGRLMCYGDWKRLPADLRARIWEHYRPGQNALTCSPEYRDALRDVLAYARRVNAEAEEQVERQRQADARQGSLW